MKSKLFTLTVTLIALLGLSLLVAAQTRGTAAKFQGPVVSANPRVPMATTLKCAPYNKEMNQKIFLTNNTPNVVKKGTVVKYSLNNQTGNITLGSDLAVNATITPQTLSYEGQPSCKAWF